MSYDKGSTVFFVLDIEKYAFDDLDEHTLDRMLYARDFGIGISGNYWEDYNW